MYSAHVGTFGSCDRGYLCAYKGECSGDEDRKKPKESPLGAS